MNSMPRKSTSTDDPFDAAADDMQGPYHGHDSAMTAGVGKSIKRKKRSTKGDTDAKDSVKPVALPTPPADHFTTAPDQKGFPMPGDLQRGFETIVVDLFGEGYDAVAEWKAVNDGLEIEGGLTPGAIQIAANKQEKIADRAFRLYIVARREYSAYMRETEPIVGAIREAAVSKLEKEKRTKVLDGDGKKVPLRTKQITEADVTAASAELYPDEWSNVCDRREKAELMLKQIENLAGLARSRAFTVSNMLSPSGRRTVG